MAATINIVMGFVHGQNIDSGSTPLMHGSDFQSETIVGVTTTVRSALVADKGRNRNVVRICPLSGNVYVKCGLPGVVVASSSDGIYVAEGNPEYFALQDGDTIALVEA